MRVYPLLHQAERRCYNDSMSDNVHNARALSARRRAALSGRPRPGGRSHSGPIRFEIVAIAASAGGLKALSEVLSALPAEFPTAILVVQHVGGAFPSQLASILSRRTALRVKEATEGSKLLPGTVYCAPSDHHLLVNRNRSLSLSRGERVHFTRPAADPLFETVAASFQERALAVVLTGGGEDGAAGVRAIKRHGGSVIAQERSTSFRFLMPRAAIETGCVDFVLPLPVIGPALVTLAMVQGAASLFGIPTA